MKPEITMRDAPSAQLVTLLESLGLATREQLHAARHSARRLARDLPLFESVWVDALVQSRSLTPYQAARINAGRADELRIGPYVVENVVSELSVGTLYSVRAADSEQNCWLVAIQQPQRDVETIAGQLDELCERSQPIESEAIVAVDAVGVHQPSNEVRNGRQINWVACQKVSGVSAADWMVPEGRFPPEAVLEIARQMTAALVQLERVAIVHGDLSADTLYVDHTGQVRLLLPGVRAVVRPEEGYALTDRRPSAYDYLSPERVTTGSPPNVASDLCACGLLWWHLLTGRPPLAGGNALAKLKAAQVGKVMDVCRLAPETPPPLAEAIACAVERDPAERPASFADLAGRLGEPTPEGKAAVARCLTYQAPLRSRLVTTALTVKRSRHMPVGAAALAGCLLLVLGLTWPYWRAGSTAPLAHIWSGKTGGTRAETTDAGRGAGGTTDGQTGIGAGHRAQTGNDGERVANSREPDAILASHSTTSTEGGATGIADQANELVLPSDEVVHLDMAALRPGMTVRPEHGRRARVVAPPEGLTVKVDGVRFEDVDFIASVFASQEAGGETDTDGRLQSSHPIITLHGSRATLQACSFQAEPAAQGACIAIAWRGGASDDPARLPEGGKLRLVDCAMRNIDVVVDAHRSGPLELEIDNTLHLGPGPLVRLRHAPALEEGLSLRLARCTVRDASSLVELTARNAPSPIGSVFIEASDCVFALARDGRVLHIESTKRPDELLESIIWTGQGSLLVEPARFAAWYDERQQPHAVDDGKITIDGLVTSRVEFAAPAAEGPVGSRIVSWSAPLRGDRPPGISPSPLVLPELK